MEILPFFERNSSPKWLKCAFLLIFIKLVRLACIESIVDENIKVKVWNIELPSLMSKIAGNLT